LRPSYRLAELLQSPEPARQRDERVRQVGHERLAFRASSAQREASSAPCARSRAR
jgi:hypothetical protein